MGKPIWEWTLEEGTVPAPRDNNKYVVKLTGTYLNRSVLRFAYGATKEEALKNAEEMKNA